MFSCRRFFRYSLGVIFKPLPTLRALAAERSRACLFAAYLLFGLLHGAAQE